MSLMLSLSFAGTAAATPTILNRKSSVDSNPEHHSHTSSALTLARRGRCSLRCKRRGWALGRNRCVGCVGVSSLSNIPIDGARDDALLQRACAAPSPAALWERCCQAII
jgi:hypothetical protein